MARSAVMISRSDGWMDRIEWTACLGGVLNGVFMA
jgi:hypothetical protein